MATGAATDTTKMEGGEDEVDTVDNVITKMSKLDDDVAAVVGANDHKVQPPSYVMMVDGAAGHGNANSSNSSADKKSSLADGRRFTYFAVSRIWR